MAGKVSMLASYAKNEQSSHEQIHRTIREYEAMFEELKTMTSTTSLKEIISSYSTNEEEMFSLYRYCFCRHILCTDNVLTSSWIVHLPSQQLHSVYELRNGDHDRKHFEAGGRGGVL